MNRLKKFWIIFLSFLPIGAGAIPAWLIGIGIGAAGIAGFSVYRTFVPVDMAGALEFFSSCWSCQMFAEIMSVMSSILPKIYNGLGPIIVPFAIALTAIWFVWQLLSGFMNGKQEDTWALTSKFGVHIIKLGVVSILLFLPLPRMISQIAIEPIFNIGLSLNRAIVHNDEFDSCIVATALAENITDVSVVEKSAFSPKLRNNLACELGGVHQMTGLGMAIGWTMMNMAFNKDYMYTFYWNIPIFPNLGILFSGLLVFVLFFMALVPIPIYFLEIFIKLSLDLVMLPFMLLSWLFDGWAISLKGAGKTIRGIIDDVINGTLGLAVTGIFVSFSIMFIDAVFGQWQGISAIKAALNASESDAAKILMDSLMMKNDSLITTVLMGVFLCMFMTMIPALSKTLFKVQISKEFYDSTKQNAKIAWSGMKKFYESLKK